MNKNNFILYKVENVENGRVYIGSTTSTIEERKKDHIQKAINETGYQFQEAIGTYGPEAFCWEQIDTAISINELASKEKEYIIKYNSKNEGYNSDCGGGIMKNVYQYNIDGSLFTVYADLQSAANAINVNKKKISKTCLSINQYLEGFYWSYDLIDNFIPNVDKRKKKVIQKSAENKLIAEFNSVAEASRITGINKSSIAKTCRGVQKLGMGYIWSYK